MGAGAPGRRDGGRGDGVAVAAESPRDVLDRWELHGAVWRVVLLRDDHAEIDLCACTGERVDRLVSGDRDLIAYLRARPSSEEPAPS